tara:strand:+ start:484 stop:2163 length:1680 start_codon:yes stop_codon:yes gene_type:complete
MTNSPFEDLIKNGNEKYENRDYEGGIEDYSKAIAINPQSEEAFMQRAMLHALRGDIELACEDWKKASELGNSDANNFLEQYSKNNKKENAESNDRNIENLVKVGIEKFDNEDYEGATKEFIKVLAINPNHAESYRYLGIINWGEDDKTAQEYLTKYIQINPNNPQVYGIRSHVNSNLGQEANALDDVNKQIELSINVEGIEFTYIRRAELRFKSGDTEGAIKDFEKALEIDPNNSKAKDCLNKIKEPYQEHLDLAERKFKESDIKGARKELMLALHFGSKDASDKLKNSYPGIQGLLDTAINNIVLGLIKEKFDISGAIQEYSKAIESDSKDGNAFYFRAIARMKLGDNTGSVEDLRQAIKINPLNKGDEDARNLINYQLDDDYEFPELATDILGTMLSLYPNIAPKDSFEYKLRGITRGQRKDLKGAISDLTTSIEMCSPGSSLIADLYVDRGNYKDVLGESTSAINDYSKAIEIDPTLGRAYYERGVAVRDAGNENKAIDDFTKSIELDPNFALAYRNRGSIKYRNSDMKSACEDWKKAADLGDEDAAKLLKEHCNG